VKISNIIKKIPYFSNYYHTIEDYDFINISQLNEKLMEKLTLDQNKYLLFKYKMGRFVPFSDFLFSLPTCKLFMYHSMFTLTTILDSLIQLERIGINYFNIDPGNLFFNLDCGEKLILDNFKYSLQFEKLSVPYISNIIEKVDNFTYQPLEIHLLFYIIKNNIDSLTRENIETICEVFVNNLTILKLFSQSYKDSYKTTCIKTLEKYIDVYREGIINDILESHNKWDIYSASLLYLHIFGHMAKAFSLKGTSINKILVALSKNLHPDPEFRMKLIDFRKLYEDLLNGQKDWMFVNALPNDKLRDLFDDLTN
jgi:hypothetical protein